MRRRARVTPTRTHPLTEADALVARFGSARPDERLRADLRAACLRSTYAFAQVVCGIRDMVPHVHGEMAAWEERDTLRKLGLWPRDFMKTNVCTIAGKLRRVTRDPSRRIVIINEVVGNTIKWITFMQRIVESPLYNWLFPEVIPDYGHVRWNQTQLELRRSVPLPQPCIEGIGVGGASTGNHYDYVHEDDLVGMEARESPTVMQKAIDQHIAAESLVTKGGAISTVGTRWHAQDLVAWMLTHEANLDYVHRAIEYDGRPYWPEGFDAVRIAALRAKEPVWWFELQRMNEALASGATEFDQVYLRPYREATVPTRDGGATERAIVLLRADGEGGPRVVRLADCTCFQTIDAGLSPESPDARTANVVVALTPPIVDPDGVETDPFQVVVLGADARRCDPQAAIRAARESYERFEPSIAAIETFGAHVVYFHWLARTYPRMRIMKLPTDTRKSKLTRIREFYPYATQGRVWIPERGPAFADLRTEWVAFPNGRTVDLLDALAYAPRIWWEPEAQTTDGARAALVLRPGQDPDEARAEAADDARIDASRSAFTGY